MITLLFSPAFQAASSAQIDSRESGGERAKREAPRFEEDDQITRSKNLASPFVALRRPDAEDRARSGERLHPWRRDVLPHDPDVSENRNAEIPADKLHPLGCSGGYPMRAHRPDPHLVSCVGSQQRSGGVGVFQEPFGVLEFEPADHRLKERAGALVSFVQSRLAFQLEASKELFGRSDQVTAADPDHQARPRSMDAPDRRRNEAPARWGVGRRRPDLIPSH
jgi:hypothetical protein